MSDLTLKGQTERLNAFESLGPGPHDDSATEDYIAAFTKLSSGDPGALGAFAVLISKRPDDGLASFHLKRLLNGATGANIVLD